MDLDARGTSGTTTIEPDEPDRTLPGIDRPAVPGASAGGASGGAPGGAVASPARPARLLPRWGRWTVGLLAALALVLRAGMLFRSFTTLDRMFVPDDTYYTLAIARSLAEGTGPSADGGHTLTTGFQPLIAFLTTPVFWFTSDATVPVRFTLAVLSVADVVTVVLLALLAARVAGPVAGVVAAAVWALSPISLSIAMNGLEASLSVAVSLALVEAWCRARETSSGRRWLLVGALAGLCLLARIDTVFLIGGLGGLQLLSRRWKGLVWAVPAAVVVVAPWWVVSVVLTGSPIPESGGAVGNLVAYHRANGLTVPRSLALASGRLLGEPVRDLPAVRGYLEAHEVRGLAVTGLLCAGMVLAGAVWAWSGRRRPGTSTLPLLALGVHGTAVLLFYGVVNAAPWFYDRYLLPAVAVLTLLAATIVGALCRWAWGRRPARGRAVARPLAAVGLLAAAAVVVVGVAGTAGLFRLHPEGSVDAGYDGAKGYAEVSRQILGATPRGAVLGSLQTGALSYFSQVDHTGVHVVNLDGVVDKGAADALAAHRLSAYAEQRGMTHFADWPFNVGVFDQRSDAPGAPKPVLTPVTTAKRQGVDQFVLFRVAWPAG